MALDSMLHWYNECQSHETVKAVFRTWCIPTLILTEHDTGNSTNSSLQTLIL